MTDKKIKQEIEKSPCWRCGSEYAIKGKIYCKSCMRDLRQYEKLIKLREDQQFIR